MQANPDLQEFLSALNGFLAKPAALADSGYVRFLEVFFRTVKASKGHLLKLSDTGVLQSILSFGLTPEFEEEFNHLHNKNLNLPCPLDIAFKKEEAIAIVDLKKEPNIPTWFMALMMKQGFDSLVCVPLMGKAMPVAILCAYYDDICLFDEGTLDHLMMMGRMVGGASEKSIEAASAEEFGLREKWLDQYLHALTVDSLDINTVYRHLVSATQQGLQVNGVLAGRIHIKNGRSVFVPIATRGVPENFLSQPITLPKKIMAQLEQHEWVKELSLMTAEDMGNFAEMIPASNVNFLISPLKWSETIQGALIVWRLGGGAPFEKNDFQLLTRMALISSLSLRAAS